MPFAVPTIPVFSFTSDGVAGAVWNLTPIQAGSTSRIGGSIFADPPGGLESAITAWGFMAGVAPPGTTSLVVAATGTTFVRGACFTVGGYARAYADIRVVVDEFEPQTAVQVHSGLGDPPDPVTAPAEFAPPPTATVGHLAFRRTVRGSPTIIINQETSVIGFQITPPIDAEPDATRLDMPITPGNAYRWWISSLQYAICQGPNPGDATSNFAFDFGPVFFAFI